MKQVGETGYLLDAGSSPAALALYQGVQEADLPPLEDVIPGAASVLVLLREPADDPAVAETLRTLESSAASLERGTGTGAEHEIVVRYDGPDLGNVAQAAALSRDDVITLHSAAHYRVAFVGFQPGFAYLSGLPEALVTPRRHTPRAAIPTGSVAIGGEWTGVYPAESPGGWNLLGTSDVVLFDATAEPPARLRPGDHVRFKPR